MATCSQDPEIHGPLLNEKNRAGKYPTWSAASTLCVSCLGSGILSFPHALSKSRLPAYLLASAFVLAACTVSLSEIISHACGAVHRDAATSVCYERLVNDAIGRRTALLSAAAVALNQFGTLVGFLVAIADFGEPLLHAALPSLPPQVPKSHHSIKFSHG